ncbi:MAG: WecB/TagA/CpsF family glycosyltransferase [bacterium]|nr:WecB/TagA/CpsF family glycosyltransferase [bacterium]
MEKINILGVNVTNIAPDEALYKIKQYLYDWKQHTVVTPNPEIILEATEKDEELHYILNHADLALADGVALKFASWLYGKNIERTAGADLVINILELARAEKKKVAIFNWQDGLSSGAEIKQALADKFPGLEIFVQDIERSGVYDFTEANHFAPEIIFCALGFPYQEKFIYYNLAKIPTARIGMSVGGSFDFLTGQAKRAPRLLRKIGLEWLWRLAMQPKRTKRIYRATVVFTWRFLVFYFILRWRYRPNVACLLFRRENGRHKILIVKRVGEREHWQLPQGGTDGESLLIAGARELKEELNTDNIKSVAVFKNLHKYEFNKRFDENGLAAEYVPIQRGYKGQKQSLLIAEFTGEDSEIKVNDWEHRAFAWVDAEKLVEAVHPVRRQSAKIFMEKFYETIKSN